MDLFPDKSIVECLRFQSEIHDSYSTFLETLVEQFAAVSYGDLIFGRQVSVYLHRCTEAVVRLYAWNALSNARVLELLPPLEKCIAETDGYLEPIEVVFYEFSELILFCVLFCIFSSVFCYEKIPVLG